MIQKLNSDQYIDNRLDDQINWYDNKAIQNKRWHLFLSLFVIILSSFIVIISSFYTSDHKNLILSLSGVATTIIAGIINIYKFQENWTTYRTISESLKHQKYLFLTGTTPYSGADAFEKFVHQCEGLISDQNNKWAQALEGRRPEAKARAL